MTTTNNSTTAHERAVQAAAQSRADRGLPPFNQPEYDPIALAAFCAALSAPEAVDTDAMHGPSFSELLRASCYATYAAEQRLVFDGDDWTPETEAPYREAQRRHFALCRLAPSAFTAAW